MESTFCVLGREKGSKVVGIRFAGYHRLDASACVFETLETIELRLG